MLTGRAITLLPSNASVATVNTAGSITTFAPGTTTITATSEGQSGSAVLTVTPVPVPNVTVSLAAQSLPPYPDRPVAQPQWRAIACLKRMYYTVV